MVRIDPNHHNGLRSGGTRELEKNNDGIQNGGSSLF
jgi:hypothetical protein